MEKKIETENFTIEQIGSGCFRTSIKSQIEFTLDVAKEFDAAANNLTEMKKHVMVFNAANMIYAHSDARDYIKQIQEKNQTAVAVAFIANSTFAKVAGNIFITVTRPNFEIQIFTNSIKAEAWAKLKYKEYQLNSRSAS